MVGRDDVDRRNNEQHSVEYLGGESSALLGPAGQDEYLGNIPDRESQDERRYPPVDWRSWIAEEYDKCDAEIDYKGGNCGEGIDVHDELSVRLRSFGFRKG